MILNNLISSIRQQLSEYNKSSDGSRDYNKIFKYPESLCFEDYLGMYERGGIAKAIVDRLPKACWRDVPKLKVGDKEVFIEEIKELKALGLFDALERADRANRIGSYSLLYLGVGDNVDNLAEPISTSGNINDLYFNIYTEKSVHSVDLDQDANSRNYGKPITYTLSARYNNNVIQMPTNVASKVVHSSRLVHLAEGAIDHDLVGTSALKPIYNALLDKDKVRGGSAEAYFRNVGEKFALMVDKDASLSNDPEKRKQLSDELESFTNNWQQFIKLQNMEMERFETNLTSPRDAFDIIMEEISGQTEHPIRLLTGKGSATIVGSEDKASWNATVLDRKESFCTKILLNALNILANANIIPDIPKNLVVEWEEGSALSESEKAEVVHKKAQAYNSLTSANSNMGADIYDQQSVLDAVGLEDLKIDGELDEIDRQRSNIDKDDSQSLD